MKKVISVVITVCMLMGCAPQAKIVIPEGKSKEEYSDALWECQQETAAVTFSGSFLMLIPPLIIPLMIADLSIKRKQQQELYECMVRKGFVDSNQKLAQGPAKSGGPDAKPSPSE
jgi:hypothetical protein